VKQVRRRCLLVIAGLPLWSACDAAPAIPEASGASPENRLEGIGATLIVDAVRDADVGGQDVWFYANEFYAEDDARPFYRSSVTRFGNKATLSFSAGHVPEKVRVIWRKTDVDQCPCLPPWGSGHYYDNFGKSKENYLPPDGYTTNVDEEIAKRKRVAANLGIRHQGPWTSAFSAEILGDHTIPVASRIPDELIADLRKNGGGLRLKFRLHKDGVYLGWDIARRSPLWNNYTEQQIREKNLYIPPDYLHIGGDFKEATPIDSPTDEFAISKGWYIDAKTGRKIETDY
jgi:hypothetical protein